jgi:hypothetical protein
VTGNPGDISNDRLKPRLLTEREVAVILSTVFEGG